MNHDVAIVGAGIVGATLAVALGRAGLRVALVEAREPQPPEAGWSARVSAISVASQRVFEALGVWELVAPQRRGPFSRMRVWERPGTGEIGFDAEAIDQPVLGHIIENARLLHALEERLSGLETVRWYRPARLQELRLQAGDATLRLDQGVLHARLVVGADGTRSRVRELAGIGCSAADYEQRAVVARVRTARAHQETAWQCFTAHGPLAFLPLADGSSAIVWSTPAAHAEELLESDEETFAVMLEEAYAGRLGEVRPQGPRDVFTLRSLHAWRYVAERVALVGDSAHTIHPLAGQGVNLGVLDVAALTQVIERAHGCQRDLGRRANLRPYERWRRAHNALVRAAMTGFYRLFGTQAAPLRELRIAGLALADRVDVFKRLCMVGASGVGGDLPALARPRGAAPG